MTKRLDEDDQTADFEAMVLPHLDAAYNLARWLTRDAHAAEDLVQAACVRAFRFFGGFNGLDARAWLMTIVRNTYFSSLREARHEKDDVEFDEALHGAFEVDWAGDPAAIAANGDACRVVNEALARLPQAFREVIVLKEMDDLSYKQIADIAGIPIGTVMSRLSRARKLLLDYLKPYAIGA